MSQSLPKHPAYTEPIAGSQEWVVLNYFRAKLPKHWRGIITYNGVLGQYEVAFDWLENDRHLMTAFHFDELDFYFSENRLIERAKIHFDDLINKAIQGAM